MSKESNGASGVLVHAVKAVAVHMPATGTPSRMLTYGDELLLTPEIIAANKDRNGHCALVEGIDQPGHPLRSGPWPDGVDRVEEGSAAWDDRRVRALQAVALLPEEDQRAAAARVRELYGVDASAASRTIAVYGSTR